MGFLLTQLQQPHPLLHSNDNTQLFLVIFAQFVDPVVLATYRSRDDW